LNIVTLIIIAVSLAMDAFAVSVAKGIASRTVKLSLALQLSIFFGLFQGLMPILGWYSGSFMSAKLQNYDHWIAFVILSAVGGKMIYEAFQIEKEEEKATVDYIGFYLLISLSIATSIDAFAVGFSFSFLKILIFFPALIIGIVTFIFSFAGTYIGNKFGHFFENKIEIVGGIILILVGLKILLSHLLDLPF